MSGELILAILVSLAYIHSKEDSRAYSRLFLNADELVIDATRQVYLRQAANNLRRLLAGIPWEDASIALGSMVFLLYTISSIYRSDRETDLLENILNPNINREFRFIQFLPRFLGLQ